jgi:hypothetical protein
LAAAVPRTKFGARYEALPAQTHSCSTPAPAPTRQ